MGRKNRNLKKKKSSNQTQSSQNIEDSKVSKDATLDAKEEDEEPEIEKEEEKVPIETKDLPVTDSFDGPDPSWVVVPPHIAALNKDNGCMPTSEAKEEPSTLSEQPCAQESGETVPSSANQNGPDPQTATIPAEKQDSTKTEPILQPVQVDSQEATTAVQQQKGKEKSPAASPVKIAFDLLHQNAQERGFARDVFHEWKENTDNRHLAKEVLHRWHEEASPKKKKKDEENEECCEPNAATAPVITGLKMVTLEKTLSLHTPEEKQHLFERGILKSSDNISPRIQATVLQLEKQTVTDKLTHSIEQHPQNRQELLDRGILQVSVQDRDVEKSQIEKVLKAHTPEAKKELSDRRIIKDTITDAAVQLEREMTKDKLGHVLEQHTNEQRKELADKGILREPIEAKSHQLETQLTKDKLTHVMQHRREDQQDLLDKGILQVPIKDRDVQKFKLEHTLSLHTEEDKKDLQEKGILKDVVQDASIRLQQQMARDKVGHALEQHTSELKKELSDKGILREPIEAQRQKLETQITKDKLNHAMQHRKEDQLTLLDKGILQVPIKDREVQKHKLERALSSHTEEDKKDLQEKGILKDVVTDASIRLQQQMAKDKVGHTIEQHTSEQRKELLDKGILKEPITAQREKLETQLKKDKLNQAIQHHKADHQTLLDKGILQVPVKDRELTKLKIERSLSGHNEEDKRGLQEKGILKNSLSSKSIRLQNQMTKDKLEQQYGNHSPEHKKTLMEKGILKEPIQQLSSQLDLQLKKNKLAKKLSSRSLSEQSALKQKGLLRDPGAVELEFNTAKDKLQHNFERRSSYEQLQNSGLPLGPSTVAPSLRSTAHKLSTAQTKDSLSAFLRGDSRPTQEEMKPLLPEHRMAPSLQPTGKTLAKGFIRNTLQQKLQERPSKIIMEQTGLLHDALDARTFYSIALKTVAQMSALEMVNFQQKAILKEKILDDDGAIKSAVQVFAEDRNLNNLLETFVRLSLA